MHRLAALALWGGALARSPCEDVLDAFNATSKFLISEMMLATGTNLPFDAGKFNMCENTKNPFTGEQLARLHLVTFDGTISLPIPGTEPIKNAMEFGICLPMQCSKEDVKEIADPSTAFGRKWGLQFVPLLNPENSITVANITSTSQADLLAPDVRCWIGVAVTGLLVCLMLVSTAIIELGKRREARAQANAAEALMERGGAAEPRRGLESNLVFKAFSLTGPEGTFVKLWQCPPYKDTDCLNGLRVLAMFWVVLGHTFLMAEAIAGYENAADIVMSPLNPKAAETHWIFMFVLNGQLSVDTFFFLGGFLFSLLTVKELQKSRGRFSQLSALMLRYLRLTPSLSFVMLVYYFVWPMLATGPFAPRFQNSVYRRCDVSWWSELTYVLNFIPFDSDSVCMGWTWYLGDDMIFFIVGIFVVPLYYRSRVMGWLAVAILSAASFAVTGYLILKYHLAPEALDYHNEDYSYYAYSKPYTRIPAYFVGLVSAWVLLNMEERGITPQTGWVGPTMSTVLWIFAVGFLVFLILIPGTDYGNRRNSWSDTASFFYLTFARPAWAACWALVTFLCYFGNAPVTNGLLSHRCWTPLARLTYGAYLCHPLVIKLSAANAHQYYTFGTMDLTYRFCGNVVCAYGLSFAVWCLMERPVMTFTSALLKSKKGAKSEKKTEKDVAPAEFAKEGKPVTGK